MVSMTFVFWMYVVLMAVIGAMRGWAKELLVMFSAILALFIITVLETYVGFVQNLLLSGGPAMEFWVRTGVILLLAFFGYQTPNITRFVEAARREKLQDSLLGLVLGAGNGYVIIGSIWAYLDRAGYIYPVFVAPTNGTPAGQAALELVTRMPPNFLQGPGIFFAIAIAFTFVVIVYV